MERTKGKADCGAEAVRLYSQGYNCAKCVYLAIHRKSGSKPDGDVVKICSAFGGGMGQMGSVCGAMVGAQMAIAERTGTTTKDNPEHISYLQAAKMANKFKKRFGSFDCKKLTGKDYVSKRHEAHCAEIVSWAAETGLGAIKTLKKKRK